jgi:hypothetical protein
VNRLGSCLYFSQQPMKTPFQKGLRPRIGALQQLVDLSGVLHDQPHGEHACPVWRQDPRQACATKLGLRFTQWTRGGQTPIAIRKPPIRVDAVG